MDSNQAQYERRDEIIINIQNQQEGRPQWYSRQLAANRPIDMSHFNNDLQNAVEFYKGQVNKLFFANNVINTQLLAALKEKNQLKNALNSLKASQKDQNDQKKKRHRRCANQIQKTYVCPVQKCQKSYGTQGSLLQHLKLKHPQREYIQLERNKEAKQQKDDEAKNEGNINIKQHKDNKQ